MAIARGDLGGAEALLTGQLARASDDDKDLAPVLIAQAEWHAARGEDDADLSARIANECLGADSAGEGRVAVDARKLAYRLSSFHFVYFLLIGAFQPYFPLYLKSLGLSAADIGVLLSTNPMVRVVGSNLWAWLADHRGVRVSLTRVSAVGITVAFVLLMWGSTFAWLLVSLLILNFFWCGTLPLMEVSTFSHLRGRLGRYGRSRVWGSFSYVVAVVGLGYLFEWLPISAVLWVLLVIFAAVAWSTYLLPADVVHASSVAKPPIINLLRQPEVVALFVACLLMAVAHGP